MKYQETKALTGLITTLRPAQTFDDDTIVAWHMVFGDDEDPISFDEAFKALKRCARTCKWIGTDDICREVEAVRASNRGIDFEVIPAPDADPDDPIAYNEALRALIREMGDQVREPYPYTADGIERQRRLLGGAFALPRGAGAPAERLDGPDRPDEWFEGRAVLSGHSEEFLRKRALANTVPCRHLGCEVGRTRPCHVDGKTLEHSPAHLERLIDVGLESEPVVPSRAELDAWLVQVAEEGKP